MYVFTFCNYDPKLSAFRERRLRSLELGHTARPALSKRVLMFGVFPR